MQRNKVFAVLSTIVLLLSTLFPAVQANAAPVPPPASTFIQISAGFSHVCGVQSDGTVVCWGRTNLYGQSTPPAGTFKQVSGGGFHTCAIATDDTLVCWGAGTTDTHVDKEYGQSIPPAGTFTQVTTGDIFSCALQSGTGLVTCWGDNSSGQSTPPAGAFTQVTAGALHTCGLQGGAVLCWGDNSYNQQDNIPTETTFTQISAGDYHTCALKSDGSLACWGWDNFGQTDAPAGTYTQVSGGGYHTCAIKSDGTLACWGLDNFGQATPPVGTFKQVTAGGHHTCAIRTDDSVTCWGMQTISGNAGIAGAVLSYNDGTDKTVTADGHGDYVIPVPYHWSGTITPSLAGYTFAPANRAYSDVVDDWTGEDYVASLTPTETSGPDTPTATDQPNPVTSTATDQPGPATDTPVPTELTPVTSPTPANVPMVTISGNAGVAGVTLLFTGDSYSTMVGSGEHGDYSLTVPQGSSGQVTPTLSGYYFLPGALTYDDLQSDQTGQDYTATKITYTIAGDAGAAGVTLAYELPDERGTPRIYYVISDAEQHYSITLPYDWSGTVSPKLDGYTFLPARRTYSMLRASQENENYTTVTSFTVSGNTQIAGVTLSLDAGDPAVSQTTVSDSNGYYSFIVPYNSSGTIRPSLAGTLFSPLEHTFHDLQADAPGLNFTASTRQSTGSSVTTLSNWNTFVGGSGNDTSTSTAVDANGFVYVTGSGYDRWSGTVIQPIRAFTPGSNEVSGARTRDAFVAKFDPSGHLVWYTFIGDTGDDSGTDIALDTSSSTLGAIYVTGVSVSNYRMEQGELTSDSGAFLAKLTPDGQLVWDHSGYAIEAPHLAVKDQFTIYLTGSAYAGITLPAKNLPVHVGSATLYLAKLDGSGNVKWRTFWGGGIVTEPTGIVLGRDANVYITGNESIRNFDSWPYGTNWSDTAGNDVPPALNNIGEQGAFFARFSSEGDLRWYSFPILTDPSDPFSSSNAIALDAVGDVYGTGGNIIVKVNHDNGKQEAADLRQFWTKKFGEPDGAPPATITAIQSASAIVLDAEGNIYIGGTSAVLNGGTTASWGLPSTAYHPGPSDAFAAKFDPQGKLLWNTFRGSADPDSGAGLAWSPVDQMLILTGISAATWGLPIAPFGADPGQQGFLAKINPAYGEPLVIVHGWLGLPAQLPGHECSEGIQRYDGTNSTLGALPGWLEDQGYEVWIAHWTTHLFDINRGGGTPLIEMNARDPGCIDYQLFELASVNKNPMTIVAHSTGGLISRVAINDLAGVVNIRSLYTLGTPHAGIPFFTGLLFAIDPAGAEMAPNLMPLFNERFHNRADVFYNFIGGSTHGGWADIIHAVGAGPNDGFVSKYSAAGWSILDARAAKPNVGYLPTDWTAASASSHFHQFWTDEFHANGMGGNSDNLNYYSLRSDGTLSHAFGCMLSQMFGGVVPDYCATATLDNWRHDFGWDDTGSAPANTEQKSGHLDANQSISAPLAIDATGSGTLGLFWKGDTAPTFALTAPDGQVIDPDYATAHSDQVVYRSESGNLLIYSFNNIQPGIWYLDIAAGTQPVDYQTLGTLTTGRVLSIQTDSNVYRIGDTAVITANIANNGQGLSGATVTAKLTRADGLADILSFSDQGDGSYRAAYTIPAVPGYASLEVTAEGVDAGIPFSRQQSLALEIASNDLQLTNTYSETPLDTDGDGLYEKLNFMAGIDLAAPRAYTVSADLYAGSQLVAHSVSSLDLAAGEQTITLPFAGTDIRAGGLDGPYTVTNLSFAPNDTGIETQHADNVLTTAAYTATQFGKKYFSIWGYTGTPGVVLSYVDGESKTAVSDDDGNYLITVPYNWSGTVTPYKTGYNFTSASTVYTDVQSDQQDQDYAADAITYTISGNTGLGGVTLTYTPDGGQPQTITSDEQGNYALTLPFGWYGRVTPSLAGHVFRPDHISYNLLGSPTDQNYVAVTTISGNVGQPGVVLSYDDNGPQTVTSDADGNYLLGIPDNWSGTVTPSKTGYTFTPASKDYTNVQADQPGQDYTAAIQMLTISGNTGLGGVTLTYTANYGSPQTITSDSQGDYTLALPYGWGGQVYPSLAGYTFRPDHNDYNLIGDRPNQDYAPLYSISGNVGQGGVELSYDDGGPQSVTSNPDGSYTLGVSIGWSGTVMPKLPGYYFAPVSRSYVDAGTDVSGQDYDPTALLAAGEGTGLTGEYFNNFTASGAPDFTRIDPQVNFSWGEDSPEPGVIDNDFSARWTGQIQARSTEDYVFSVAADNGVRLWIDGQLLVDDWAAPTLDWHDTAPVRLMAGQKYDVKIETFDSGGAASAYFAWRTVSGSIDTERVPMEQLYPQLGLPTATPTPTSTMTPTSTPTATATPRLPNTVQVTVRDTEGNVKPGLKVYAFNGTTYTGISGTSNAGGQVVLVLSPGSSYRFRADLNGTQFWSSASNDCAVPGCTAAGVTVTDPVTVTVQDTFGALKAGLKVYAFTGSTYSGYSGTSDANGQVILTLPIGSYRFRADLNGTQFWSSASNDCSIPGCTAAGVTVTNPVTVSVHDTFGALKSGLKVYAFNSSTYTGYSGTSDANGQVVLTLPIGSYRFRADLNGTQFWSSASNDCAVPGCAEAGVTVTNPVFVTVRDTAGAIKSGLKVYAFNAGTYTGYSGTSDVNGQVMLTLPIGGYRFRADLNGTQFWSNASNDCAVPGCTAAGVTVTNPVTVTVRDTAGGLKTGLKVYAFTGSTYSGYSGTSDINGQVVLTLPLGSYRFRADLNGAQFWSSASNDCSLPGCTSDSIVTNP